MKREEAIETVDAVDYFGMSTDHKVELSKSFIHKLYDSFEAELQERDSRTCESCRWYQEVYNEINCNCQTINVCKLWGIAFKEDMYCNK